MNTLKNDLSSGFLVFLIALPLCMGISIASGYPALAGIITASIGGLLTGLLGGSRLTIKGPAAGLIVIVLGAVQELQDPSDPLSGYKRALAVGVIAGGLQVLVGVFKMGKLANLIPTSVIHGMLAAIGIIIISKQFHNAVGVTPVSKAPADLLLEIPHSIVMMNPAIAMIGVISFAFMFFQPQIQRLLKKNIPSAIIVLVLAVCLGQLLDLQHEHTISLWHHDYKLDPHFLVNIPGTLLSAITFPDWSMLFSAGSIKYIIIFALVGSIESLLTVSAVDSLDPVRRRSDLNKDLKATGIANMLASLLGGLPMISEIVRSKANIDSGAKTHWSNFIHGALLLIFTLAAPALLKQIPVAALAAMLVYVGTRLASPKEFAHMWHIGPEQFFFFALTCFLTVTVDLLVGVAAGLLAATIFVGLRSGSLKAFYELKVSRQEKGDELYLLVESPALFCNFTSLEKEIIAAEGNYKKVVVDFANSHVVEHTFLNRLKALSQETVGFELSQMGLATHKSYSHHELATRVKPGWS